MVQRGFAKWVKGGVKGIRKGNRLGFMRSGDWYLGLGRDKGCLNGKDTVFLKMILSVIFNEYMVGEFRLLIHPIYCVGNAYF